MTRAAVKFAVFAIAVGLSCLVSLQISAAETPASPSQESAAFLRWAQQTLHPLTSLDMDSPSTDLQPLRGIIGNKRMVLLGEGQHFAAEPLAFRNRLFKYLVEELGFDAIAIESGVTESRLVNIYVLGGPGDLRSAVSQGIGNTFDLLPQNQELVRWMREYNADPNHVHKIEFFGFDVAGSPANVTVTRGPDTATNEVLRYLESVDPAEARTFKSRLQSLLPPIRWTIADYLSFPQSTRDSLTADIADLNTLLMRKQFDYVARSSQLDYAWGVRNAIAARQLDNVMRRIPLGAKPQDFRSWLSEQIAVRDQAMAENADWILNQMVPEKKVLFFAATGHVANAPYVEDGDRHVPFGAYMKERYGTQILTIGNIGAVRGKIGGCGRTIELKPMPPASANAKFAQLNVPLFLLDLRGAAASASWLQQSSDIWNGLLSDPMVLSEAFDVLFFSATFRPACEVGR
jgi:erythromycin esterase